MYNDIIKNTAHCYPPFTIKSTFATTIAMMFGERHRSYSTEMIEHIPKCFQFPYWITTWQKSLHTSKNFAQLIIKCSRKFISLTCFRTFSQFHPFFNIIVQCSETLRRILTLFWLARRVPFFDQLKSLQQRLLKEIVMQKTSATGRGLWISRALLFNKAL